MSNSRERHPNRRAAHPGLVEVRKPVTRTFQEQCQGKIALAQIPCKRCFHHRPPRACRSLAAGPFLRYCRYNCLGGVLVTNSRPFRLIELNDQYDRIQRGRARNAGAAPDDRLARPQDVNDARNISAAFILAHRATGSGAQALKFSARIKSRFSRGLLGHRSVCSQ